MVRVSYQNIEREYEEIKQSACGRQACTVMIMVAYDVDAIASSRILTQQLRRDNIAYSIRPVLNFPEAQHNFTNFLTSDIRTVFMINCGAVNNIPKAFNLEHGGDTRVFIMDNHRPFHLRNIHSRHNVVLFDDENEIEYDEQEQHIPVDGEDISSGDEDMDDDDDDEEDDDKNISDEEEVEEEEINDTAIDEINAAFGHDEENQAEEDEEDDNEKENEEEDEEEEGDGEEDGSQAEEVEDEVGEHEEIDKNETEDEGENNDDEDENDSRVGARSKAKRSVHYNEDDEKEDRVGQEENEKNEFESEDGERAVDDDGANEDEEAEVRVVGKKRRISDGERQAKQRKRDRADYYTKNVVFAAPTAMMLMELVAGRSGNQVPLEALWQAILGTTDQFQRGNISEDLYDMYHRELTTKLGEHLVATPEAVQHGAVGPNGEQENIIAAAASEHGNITDDPEYRFFLHRHWSLLEAMQHSPYIAAKLSVWNSKGISKLNELLARMGLPLAQCKQHFQFMTPSLRDHFYQQMGDAAILKTYKLEAPSVTYRSFQRFYSFANSVAASDVVYAASALVEMYGTEEYYSPLEAASLQNAQQVNDQNLGEHTAVQKGGIVTTSTGNGNKAVMKISSIEAFYNAYSCLGRAANSDQLLKTGIKNALDLQRTIVRKAAVMMDGRDSLVKLNRLYYAYLRKTSSSHSSSSGFSGQSGGTGADLSEMEHTFGRAQVLTRLGQLIMDVKRNLPRGEGGWTGNALLPLILLSERQDDSYLVVGISPLTAQCGGQEILEDQKQKLLVLTNFREFYKQAAHELRISKSVRYNSFDSNVMIVDKNDVQDFLGTLDYCYKKATPAATASALSSSRI